MAKLTPKQIAEKQVRRAQAAGPDYIAGIDGVTKHPGEAAAAKQDKMKMGILAAIDSGKWAENVAAGSLDAWKQKTKKKGGARFAQGVADAQADIEAFHAEFAPFLEGVKAQVAALPDTTPEDRIQRMVANARAIAQFKRTSKRR